MAYVAANTKLLVSGIGSGPNIWYATGVDVATDADANDFFSNGDSLGMKVGDVVFYYDTATPKMTLHAVRTQVTTGSASLSLSPTSVP